jgi:hypothetical protein
MKAVEDANRLTPTQLWVGRIRATGAIVVYDPTVQLLSNSQIYVFSVKRGVLRQFAGAQLRTMVETVHGSESDAAIAEYNSWKVQHGEEFLRTEPLRLAEEHQRISAAEERTRAAHRQHLAALGIDPTSVDSRPVAPRQHRVTNCFSCKRLLDSKVFLECSACHWIICGCGACGCGYTP